MSYSAMMPPLSPSKEKKGVPEAFVYRGDDDMKSGEVKEQFAKFFQETSFTALVRIYNASSLVKRLTWLVVVLGMLSWLTVQCYWLLSRYFNYPMEVKMDLVAAQELEFPSITVCNLNPLRESVFHMEPYHSLLAEHMQLQEEDPLYSMFNEYYYDDWYDDYEEEHKRIEGSGPMGPLSFPTESSWTSPEMTFSSILTTPEGSALSDATTKISIPVTSVGSVPTASDITTFAGSAGPGTTGQPITSSAPKELDETSTPIADATELDPMTMDTNTLNTDLPVTVGVGTGSTEGVTPPPVPPPTPPSMRRNRQAPYSQQKSQAPNSRKKRQAADMSAFLKARSFNKWDVLDNQNASKTFYEDRDKEYIASMAYAVYSQKIDPSIMIQGGHLANDFFIDCKIEGFPCSPKNFTTFINHKYGNCYTFNAEGNGPKLKTRFAGPGYGLSLELYLNQQEYIPALAPAAGARVLIHPRNSMPFPEDEGISIAPGFSTSIGLRKVDITRLPPPHGVCAVSGETEDLYKTNLGTDYSKLSCLKSCYQALVIKYCQCSVPQYYVTRNSTVCNMTDLEAEMCSKRLPDQYPADYSKCDKSCPQPCSEVRYEKTLSIAQWPSEKYAKHLQTKVQQSNYMFYGNDVEEEDFAKVQIYFEDLLYQSVEQQKAYESQNLISDIGGQLGLWLGLSAITLGELFSFLFSLGQAITRGMMHTKKKHSTPIEPVNMGPVSYM